MTLLFFLTAMLVSLTAGAEEADAPASRPADSQPSARLLPPAPPPVPAGLGLTAAEIAGADPGNLIAERIVWDKTPIPLTLPVGIERQVRFPKPVRVGVPAALNQTLRTQSADKTVYWQAQAPFENTRVLVKEIESGRTDLFDLRAVAEGGSVAPIEILTSGSEPSSEGVGTAEVLDGESAEGDSPGYVALTRFAAQQLYAPTRLLGDLPGVARTPLATTRPVPLLRGGKVGAIPIAAWRSADYYVTAVRLTNLTHAPVVLDPRDLRGQWLTATFQHARLLPAGDEADTTCLYLISARPFEESL